MVDAMLVIYYIVCSTCLYLICGELSCCVGELCIYFFVGLCGILVFGLLVC